MLTRAILLAGVTALAVAPALAGDPVARRTLRIGTILAAGDVNGPAPDALLGQEVRRTVHAGRPVTRADLGPPTLVRRNERVTMLYRRGALSIRSEGRALATGGAGEAIDVMNLASRLTVRATVTGPGAVEVAR